MCQSLWRHSGAEGFQNEEVEEVGGEIGRGWGKGEGEGEGKR